MYEYYAGKHWSLDCEISTLVCFIQKEKIHWWKEFTVYPREFYPIYDEIPDYSNST
jgi:hypothetical protein